MRCLRRAKIDGHRDRRAEPRLRKQIGGGRVSASGTDHSSETYECDALVVGSGAAGLSAAVTAGHHGLKVLAVDKETRFGGTTARSGGWLWIPNTSLARAWGIVEDPDQARTYLRHEAGNAFDAARVDAFLTAGPAAVDF